MTAEIKNVIVLGAGGNLGLPLIKELQAQSFTVSALIRPSSTATFDASIPVHKVAYDDLPALTSAFRGQDAVVSTLGTFASPAQRTAIDAAIAAGVQRFVPSEYGGDTSLSGTEEFAPFAVEKKATLEYLKQRIAEKQSGLTWTAIYTGIFIAWGLRIGNGALGWDIKRNKVTVYDGGDRPFDSSTDPQVCRAIVATLKHAPETKNQHVYVNSFVLTQNKVRAVLEKLTGKAFEVETASAKETAARGIQHLKDGDEEHGYPEVVTASIYGPWGFSEFKGKAEKWNEILGLPQEEDLESVLREVLQSENLI